MKRLAVFVSLLMLLSPAVNAQEAAQDPGVTPDSFLYGLDVAIDKISLLLTFDQAKKCKKALKIAQERLLEVREMANENKLDAMEKAQREHHDAMKTVVSSLKNLEKGNSTEEMEAEIEIEKELEEHKSKIEEVRGELEIKIKVKGEITPEQQALIDDVLSRLENTTGKVEIEINNKKEKTKIKIKTETGKSDKEIEDELEELEERKGLTAVKMEKAEEEIAEAEEKINETISGLGANATKPAPLNQAEEHLAKAKAAFDAGKYGEAYSQAKAAKNMAKEMKEERENAAEEGRELEIKVENKGNFSKVEVNYGGTLLKYRAETSNMAEIVAQIAEKTGLSKEEIEAAMTVKSEEDGEQSFEVGNNTKEIEEGELVERHEEGEKAELEEQEHSKDNETSEVRERKEVEHMEQKESGQVEEEGEG